MPDREDDARGVTRDPRVTVFDVNALVALCLSTHQHHRAAHEHLSTLGAWATCPMTETALYRLLLNPAVTGRRGLASDVGAVLSGFRTDPRWRLIPDASTLASAVVDVTVLMGHQQVTDLHLVNLAAQAGARLATFDGALTTWLSPADRSHVALIPS